MLCKVQQWLSDISATCATDGLDDGFENAEKHYDSFMDRLKQFRTHFTTIGDQTGIDKIAEIEKNTIVYYQTGNKIFFWHLFYVWDVV